VLDVRNVSFEVDGVRRLDDVSVTVRPAEIVGIAGVSGNGQTELVQALTGARAPAAGAIELEGHDVTGASPAELFRRGLAFVPEDRQHQGLVLEMAIADNATLPLLRRLTRFGLVDGKRERRMADDATRRLQVKAASLGQSARALSGGNQQKVVLAKWLATDPQVLILDEPTRGIDIGTKAEVHRIVSRLAADGMAILLISSELPEVLGMADRVLVMHEGRITGEFAGAEADQEAIMRAATGQKAGDA
jgi:rhamnose transport system ATP-binding protein